MQSSVPGSLPVPCQYSFMKSFEQLCEVAPFSSQIKGEVTEAQRGGITKVIPLENSRSGIRTQAVWPLWGSPCLARYPLCPLEPCRTDMVLAPRGTSVPPGDLRSGLNNSHQVPEQLCSSDGCWLNTRMPSGNGRGAGV